MYIDQNRISILERISLGILLVVVIILVTFNTIWNYMISFFKRK